MWYIVFLRLVDIPNMIPHFLTPHRDESVYVLTLALNSLANNVRFEISRIPTYLPTNLPTCLPTCLAAYLPA